MIYVLPILITWLTGVLTAKLMLKKEDPAPALLLFLGATVGMALSAYVVFSSLVLFGQLNRTYVIAAHLLLLAGVLVPQFKNLINGFRLPVRNWKLSDSLSVLFLGLVTLPVILYATMYPQGGWDAWACWNLKARFIFLGQENWTRLFDPVIWGSNISYPLLLPSLNVWGWTWSGKPDWILTQTNSWLITFVTAGTLLFAIKKYAGRLHSMLAPLWFLSIFITIQLAASQYSDLLVGNFFLTFLVCFLYFQRTGGTGWLAVGLLALGALSFTKSEGMALAAISLLSGTALVLFNKKWNEENGGLTLRFSPFSFFFLLFFLPTIVFQLKYAGDSHTFINGLADVAKPTSLERLKAVFVFFKLELLAKQWNGFWILALGGLVLGWRGTFRRELWIFPLVIMLYLGVVIGVYWINTFFEILWWLSTTLNRILFALMPALILWLFLTFESDKRQETGNK